MKVSAKSRVSRLRQPNEQSAEKSCRGRLQICPPPPGGVEAQDVTVFNETHTSSNTTHFPDVFRLLPESVLLQVHVSLRACNELLGMSAGCLCVSHWYNRTISGQRDYSLYRHWQHPCGGRSGRSAPMWLGMSVWFISRTPL